MEEGVTTGAEVVTTEGTVEVIMEEDAITGAGDGQQVRPP